MKTTTLLTIGALASLLALGNAGYLSASSQEGAPATKYPSIGAPCIWLASDLVGMKVVNAQDEDLGKIDDVVVHPGGEVAYAVLSFGGVLGMGDKLFAMPWSVLKAVEPDAAKKDSKRKLVLNVDKERLKKAPGFDKDKWPTMASSDWAKDVDAYYADDRSVDAKKAPAAAVRSSVITWRYSDMKGFNVETPTGEKLGDIKDVAIDTTGRVTYVVVSVGGFIGINDRLVAVPWDALKFSLGGEKGDKKMISFPSTKQQLEQAPEFKSGKDKAAGMCDPMYVENVYKYYSIRPYWTKS